MADHLNRMDFIILDELGYLPFALSVGYSIWSAGSTSRPPAHHWPYRPFRAGNTAHGVITPSPSPGLPLD